MTWDRKTQDPRQEPQLAIRHLQGSLSGPDSLAQASAKLAALRQWLLDCAVNGVHSDGSSSSSSRAALELNPAASSSAAAMLLKCADRALTQTETHLRPEPGEAWCTSSVAVMLQLLRLLVCLAGCCRHPGVVKALAGRMLSERFLDLVLDVVEVVHFDVRFQAESGSKLAWLPGALQLWSFLHMLVRFTSLHAVLIERASQMQACMSRLAALLAPDAGAVPRLLTRRLCADTMAVQLHVLQLLQLIYELPDSLLLHRTAVAQLYVQYHHEQFVLYYQGSAADPDSAAAELAWMQLQALCALSKHSGEAVRSAFHSSGTVTFLLQQCALEAEVLSTQLQMMDDHAPDTLPSSSDSDADDDSVGRDRSGSDAEGGDPSTAQHQHFHPSEAASLSQHRHTAPDGTSSPTPSVAPLSLQLPGMPTSSSGRGPASPVRPHSGKAQLAQMSRLGGSTRPAQTASQERFRFNYDLNEDVERLLALEDELGHEVELTGLDQGWEDGQVLPPRLRGNAHPGSEGGAGGSRTGDASSVSPFPGGQQQPIPASPTLHRLKLRRNTDASPSGTPGSGLLSQFGSRHTTLNGMADDEPTTPGTPMPDNLLSSNGMTSTRTSVPKLSFANLRMASTTSITSFKLLSSTLPFKPSASSNSTHHSSLAPPLTASPMAPAAPRPGLTQRASNPSTARTWADDSPRTGVKPMPTMANSTAFAALLSPKLPQPNTLTPPSAPAKPSHVASQHGQQDPTSLLSARGLLSHRAPPRMPPLPEAVAAAAASHLPSSPTTASARASAAQMGHWGSGGGPPTCAQITTANGVGQRGVAATAEGNGHGVSQRGASATATAGVGASGGTAEGLPQVLPPGDVTQARSIPMLNLSVLKKGGVMAPRFGTVVSTRLPLPTTGIVLPVTAVCITLVFQLRLIVTSLYGLNSRLPAAGGGLLGGGVGGGAGGGAGGGVVAPHAPCDVQGWPEPEPPLLVAGSLPWVHQLAR
ncbi:MAG: hypothetical protein WDW38_004144 [Sanguina aurantia]